MPTNLQAVVLAGSASERFQNNKSKFIEKICGKEMVMYSLQLLKKLQIPTTLVIGHQHEQIQKVLASHEKINLNIVLQEQPLGSGHAAMLTQPLWTQDHVLLMGADIPLLTEEVIIKLYNKHVKTDADISFITAHGIDTENKNYCRIVINDNKIHVLNNTESTQDIDSQCCISGGVYIAKKSFLEKHIHSLTMSNINQEYYLPELVQIASNNNCKIVTSPVSMDTIRCVDTLADLWAIEHIKRSQIIRYWMDHGVRVANALNVMIDESVIIEPGAFINSGVHLLGKTIIKKDVIIGAYAHIENSIIEDHSIIKSHVVLNEATIPAHSTIESFTFIEKNNIDTNQKQDAHTQLFTGAIKTKGIHKNTEL